MWTVGTLLAAGGVLLILETILPGLVAGILGFVCIVAGIGLGYARFGLHAGNSVLLVVAVILVLGAGIWVRYFPGSRIARTFISNRVVGEPPLEGRSLLNATGIAETNLRPSGAAVIDGKRVDVVTEGSMIERGSTVRVIAVEGLRVVVRAV